MPQALSKVSTIRYTSYKKPAQRAKRQSKIYIKNNKKVFGWSLFFLFLLVGLFVYNLYLNLQLVDINFSLRDYSKKGEELTVNLQNLQSKIVGITSLENIKKATTSLKLETVKNIKFVKIPSSGSLSLEK